LNRGGAETWLVQAWQHIDRRKFHFDFAVHGVRSGAYDEAVKQLGANVIPCLSPQNPILFGRNFRKVLNEYGPYDCVHSHVHFFSGYILALAAAHNVPIRIAHSHNDTSHQDSRCSAWRKLYLRVMAKLIKQFASDGLAVSDVAAESLFGRDWQRDSRWSKSYLGIDLEPFQVPIERSKVRSELGISDSAFVVGHVGRFYEQKNHRFWIDIAEEVAKFDSSAVFLLVGNGPLRSAIESLVDERGLSSKFRFVGERNDVPDLMRAAMDVFLFPSLYEGLPISVLEAQAAGLPCILSDSITPEVDAGLVERISLAAEPKVWCESVLSKKNVARKQVPLERVTITAATARLESAYESMLVKVKTCC
jgi:glycosyltransferase involved in cell wall biosynthesis